jgi:hypothetical protein
MATELVRTGQLIGLLRGADLSLADIGLILDDLATGGDLAAVERLNQLLGQMERRHDDRKLLTRHVQAILKEGDDPMFPIETRSVPSRRVMSIQRRVRADDEAYTTITKAQWAYPAILAAYDSVACSAPVRARPGSRLSCREVYLAEPHAIGEDDPICDVAFPLADL